jgi:putative nucleotidyltransferase with HDIG domain
MPSVSGSLNLMSLPDVMQWAETTRKSGTLTISQGEVSKAFYIQDGKIIFISSQKEGERLGEFFCAEGRIDRLQMSNALRDSQRLGVTFMGYLISEGLIGKEVLEQMLERLAEKAFTDALSWEDGSFEFNDSLPVMVINGPLHISISSVVFQSVKQFDEAARQKEAVDTQAILAEIARKIKQGEIEIPPVPVIMQKLNTMLQRDDTPVQDIVEAIQSDQILTAKVLKVVNSAFYSPASKITSLRQALIFMGLKSILSIITVHTMSGFYSRNSEQIKDILRHSLLCAFVAKRLASAEGLNAEEAFAAGLLHDIGKTVGLNLVSDLPVTEVTKTQVVLECHEAIGYMVTSQWNFAEVLRICAMCHHHPDQAPKAYRKMVEKIFLADLVANNRDVGSHLPQGLGKRDSDMIAEIRKEFEDIMQTVNSIL